MNELLATRFVAAVRAATLERPSERKSDVSIVTNPQPSRRDIASTWEKARSVAACDLTLISLRHLRPRI